MKYPALAVVITLGFTLSANADRPAMSERSMPAAEPAMRTPQVPAPSSAPMMQQPMQQRIETTVTGDVLEIQPGETIPVRMLDFPRRGMTMGRVQNELGEPLIISPTVGQPPITTWSYPDRKVYFEGNRVIHAVAIN